MVHWVHSYSSHGRSDAEVPLDAGLADDNVFVEFVTHDADSRHALRVDETLFGRAQLEEDVLVSLRDKPKGKVVKARPLSLSLCLCKKRATLCVYALVISPLRPLLPSSRPSRTALLPVRALPRSLA